MSSSVGDANLEMTKDDADSASDNSTKNEKMKKSIIPRIFGSKRSGRDGSDEDIYKSDGDGIIDLEFEKKIAARRKAFMEATPFIRKNFSERQTSPGIESLNLSNFELSTAPATETKEFRIFVATWNVGGKSPNNGLNLQDFLQVEGFSDIYVLGFQEIVPLSAGNVLVIEDNEPAAKWLALISQALNKPQNASHNMHSSSDSSGHGSNNSSNNNKESKSPGSLNIFQKPSLKALSKSFKANSSLLKSCNCPVEFPSHERRRIRKLSDPTSKLGSISPRLTSGSDTSVDEFLAIAGIQSPSSSSDMNYRLITSKKMVGIFVSVWVRKELVPHVGHLRVSTVGRGIMGCLGNKMVPDIEWGKNIRVVLDIGCTDSADMVPDIEWGKNIRVVLDIGCTDSAFGASLVDKDVLTLALGLKDDLVDLAQVALERGLPAFVSPFRNRRLPFPSSVFDAVHCGGCTVPWHSNGGKHLLEMNRILRPGGYFVLSTKHDSFEDEEAMTKLTASICWNILAHKTDEVSDVGAKIYQKPDSNDIYELRRKKYPPLCKENENPDAAWYVPVKTCLHPIPSAIEQHGTEWPDEWPQRLERYPDWLSDKVKLDADTKHWKAIVDRSYLTGLGIDWSKIRNVMDMKAIYGGFAAALTQQKVWVMNVVPVHAPDTLPFIFERGLVGTYHDWCESFGTYPRSYDLLHADHLFSRLKNRCKQPVSIVVEMDRLLRPGGWAIIREKVEVLEPLEGILKSMHWEIRMTFAQGKEGLLCAQKTLWRP